MRGQRVIRHKYVILEGRYVLTILDSHSEALAYAHGYEQEMASKGRLTLLDIHPVPVGGFLKCT